MGLLGKVEKGIDDARNKIDDIKNKISSQEEVNEDLKNNYSEEEARKDIELERNIFEEFEETEVELKNILSLEEEEIEALVEKVDRTIDHEEDVKATTIAFAETFRDIEELTEHLENTFANSSANFDSNILRQFFEHRPNGIKQKIDRLSSNSSKLNETNTAASVRNNLELALVDSGVANSTRDADITDMPVSLRQLYDRDEEGHVYKAARYFNEVLLYLPDENCVLPERY